MRKPNPIARALLVLAAAAAGVGTYALLRPLLRSGDAAGRDGMERFAVAGSRKPGTAPQPDSEDPLERIESQVLARETGR